MTRLPRVGLAALVSAATTALAIAQAPPATTPAQTPANTAASQAKPETKAKAAAKTPATRTQAQTAKTQNQPARRRSIVHHYPYPYPAYYSQDRSAGWRNPGGVGRYQEYYPPADQFQAEQQDRQRDSVRVAQFGSGGIPDRSEQLQAQQIGIQRYNSIQNHIDNYARPYYGYGFGVGFFGGFN
jgi:hypothetical protein